jgi:hypothetical protein
VSPHIVLISNVWSSHATPHTPRQPPFEDDRQGVAAHLISLKSPEASLVAQVLCRCHVSQIFSSELINRPRLVPLDREGPKLKLEDVRKYWSFSIRLIVQSCLAQSPAEA